MNEERREGVDREPVMGEKIVYCWHAGARNAGEHLDLAWLCQIACLVTVLCCAERELTAKYINTPPTDWRQSVLC